ncbi:trna a64-2 -o-ribosylphosphate transferase [Ceratocystis lukuohia]|uniref:Trna a64-2 -o-ribosylphosphate transferase n=1 Tax=Ceratocystis lukuohia TaxID=2019550 RepID=A0ABR4MHN5_9PEZI
MSQADNTQLTPEDTPGHGAPVSATANIRFSDIILPQQESLSHLFSDLKRANTSISNRLRSIAQDSCFVNRVAASYAPRKLVANERCGSWYVDIERKAGSAYFKSTDGHTDAWKISTRRLNVHLLRLIEEDDGCIIVDSTRRGKRMPDALSKTIPIWCAVLNMLLFPSLTSSHSLHTPPLVVSASEHAQISALIPSFAQTLSSISLDLPALRRTLTKPLRPLWITPDTPLPTSPPESIFTDFRPVICCTASARSAAGGGEISSGAGYVQGAADDTEMWAHGLTAPLFWAHRAELLETPETELPALMTRLAAKGGSGEGNGLLEVIHGIYVASLPVDSEALASESQHTCVIRLTPDTAPVTTTGSRVYSRGIGRHKAASRNLRVELAGICEFARKFIQEQDGSPDNRQPVRIVIACETARDISVGTALALSCILYNDDGSYRDITGTRANDFSKTTIRLLDG